MQIRQKNLADILVVKPLSSRIDASYASEFKTAMLEFVASGNVKFILNLSEVDFIDSSGLGSIVAVLKALGGKGYIAICGLRETVSTLFRLSHMDKIFRIFASEEDAIKHLGIEI